MRVFNIVWEILEGHGPHLYKEMKFQANFQPNKEYELKRLVILPNMNLKCLVLNLNRYFIQTYLEPIWSFELAILQTELGFYTE